MSRGFVCLVLNHNYMNFLEKYYPVILAFISFLLSVSLWFNGQKDEGMFVGIWVPSILGFGIYFRIVKNA
jgi:hypothetical protein